MSKRHAARWLCALALLGAVLAVACGGSSQASRKTPTAPSEHSPTETPRSSVAAVSGTPQPTPDHEHPNRWGFNPRKPTGQVDALPRYEALPPGYRLETIVTGLQQPTGLAFTPDGRMLIIEQPGTIRVVQDGRIQPQPYYVADAYMPDADEIIELGLVGITVDPGFAQNGYIYIYYTTEHPKRRTVLARIVDRGTTAGGLTEIMSMEADPVCCHISGSMRFAPDGTLFVSVGDHQREEDAQDLDSPFGKILRINPDGSVPEDNPFVGEDDVDPRVYAYGLRNPFDFALHPAQNRIFATENGFIGQDAILEIKPRANYGWPGFDLAVPLEQIEQPLLFYNEPAGPSGMELYLSDRLPALTGRLLFCQFHRGGALHAVSFGLNGEVDEDVIIAPGCTSDVLTGLDGFVYFLDYVSGTVYRIAAG